MSDDRYREGRNRNNGEDEKQRRGVAWVLGNVPPVNNEIYQELGLLHDDDQAKQVLVRLTDREQEELNWRVNHLLWLKKSLKRKTMKWKRNHVKACINGCKEEKALPDDFIECPECGSAVRWFKVDEKGNPTSLEQKKTPPPSSIREAYPVVHKKARNIIDRGLKRLKKTMYDRATAKDLKEESSEEDLRDV